MLNLFMRCPKLLWMFCISNAISDLLIYHFVILQYRCLICVEYKIGCSKVLWLLWSALTKLQNSVLIKINIVVAKKKFCLSTALVAFKCIYHSVISAHKTQTRISTSVANQTIFLHYFWLRCFFWTRSTLHWNSGNVLCSCESFGKILMLLAKMQM